MGDAGVTLKPWSDLPAPPLLTHAALGVSSFFFWNSSM
jgi:hypothetical protein